MAEPGRSAVGELRDLSLYLDLIKKSVLNLPYVDVELNPIQPHGRVRARTGTT